MYLRLLLHTEAHFVPCECCAGPRCGAEFTHLRRAFQVELGVLDLEASLQVADKARPHCPGAKHKARTSARTLSHPTTLSSLKPGWLFSTVVPLPRLQNPCVKLKSVLEKNSF